MTDFAALRRNMVDSQVMPSDVTDRRLLRAMGEVPREAFVGDALKPVAYIDKALKLGNERLLLAPMTIALMVQLARLEPDDTVLEIGCGSGYVSALVARLAAKVIALEVDPGLAALARANLSGVGVSNIKVVEGPLEAGYLAGAPYDAILISGSVSEVPAVLAGQLASDGRLVAIVGDQAPGRIMVFTRVVNALSGREFYDCSLAPLPGFEKVPSFVF